MNIKIIKTLSIMGLFCFLGCNKYKYEFKACFNTEKEEYSIGEEILFENCSTLKGNKEGVPYGVVWRMGDGKVLFSFNNEPITHSYSEPGEYTVNLLVGRKEGPQDELEKIIKIVN